MSLSHKYQWNKPSTCPYITYIQGGRQDRKTGNWRKLQHYMRKGRRKKKLTPRLCSIEEYSVRTEKNTSAQKHIYHKHNFATGETYPALASSRPVRRHLLRRRSQTRLTKPGGTKPEAVGRGRGIMSVIGEVARESRCSALPRVVIQHGLGRARCRYGGARKR